MTLPEGWDLTQYSSGLLEARHTTRLTICYGNTEAEVLEVVTKVETAIVTSRVARIEWESRQKSRKTRKPVAVQADTQLSLFE